jgi:hypothetical protein
MRIPWQHGSMVARQAHGLAYDCPPRAPLGSIMPYQNFVFPGKYGQLIEAGDEVPARGDVASDEDAEGEG